jgi:hypothetical protein
MMSASPHYHRRTLHILVVVILVLLTVQGWSGDVVNLFAVFPSAPVATSVAGFFQAIFGVGGVGPLMVYHASEGILLFALSVAALALSFLQFKKWSVRICAILGFIYIVLAGTGGLLFVFSTFTNNGNSAQMGGSFIGAYAFYFMLLYYAKPQYPLQQQAIKKRDLTM